MSLRRIHQLLGLGFATIGLCSSSFATTYDAATGLPTGVTNPVATPMPSLLGTPPPPPVVCPNQSANVQTGAQNNIPMIMQMLAGLSRSDWDKRDKAGDQYDKTWNVEKQVEFGAMVDAEFGKGCQNFFTKDGKLQPWGQTAVAEIRKRPEIFIEKTPRDITKYCKDYGTFSTEQKERFWAWNLMSMASAESSCDPKATARGPNGIAKGLFQTDDNICHAFEYESVHGETQCAVRRLSKELKDRGTLMSTCSARCANPKDATHWAVLRGESAYGAGDKAGAQRMQILLKKFKDCNN